MLMWLTKRTGIGTVATFDGPVPGPASVNGADCCSTAFYDSWHFWDNDPIGYAFTLYSRQLVHYGYSDADLRDGAGESNSDWSDRLEASVFTGCF